MKKRMWTSVILGAVLMGMASLSVCAEEAEIDAIDQKYLQLGSSSVGIKVPADYQLGSLAIDDIKEGQVGYYQSETHLMDFDVYLFDKEGMTLDECVADEIQEFPDAVVLDTVQVGAYPVASYTATETYEGQEYKTWTCITEDGSKFVEVVFWLDGDEAQELSEQILASLVKVEDVVLGESFRAVTIPKGYEFDDSDLSTEDGQTAYFMNEEKEIEIEVYEFLKSSMPLEEYAQEEAAGYETAEYLGTVGYNGLPVASYITIEELEDAAYTTWTCITEAGDEYVEVVFWMKSAASVAEAAAIMNSIH